MSNADKPAYPDPMRGAEQSFINQSPHELNEGLTKRELFAMAAMQGLLAKDSWASRIIDEEDEATNETTFLCMRALIAKASVVMADELLKKLDHDNRNRNIHRNRPATSR